MTTAVNTLLSRATQILNDSGYTTWTQAELVDWLNEGQAELATKRHADAYMLTTNVTLVAGAKQTAPANCVKIFDIRQNNGGNAVTPCDRKFLDHFSPDWMVSPTSNTIKHWMDDPQPDTFYVYPAQNGTPASIVVTYGAVPGVVAAGQNILVRDIYAADLVNYMLFRAYSKDIDGANAERAVAYGKAFYG